MRSGLKRFLTAITALVIFSSATLAAHADWIDATHLFEAEVKSAIESIGPDFQPSAITRNRASAPVERPKVGDIQTFWTKNIVENQFEETRAVLKVIGKHCYIFLEEHKALTAEAIEKIRSAFDDTIYPTNTSYFGSEPRPGLDGDDKIFLLLFDIKDGYNGSGGFVGGYFYALDTYPKEKIPAHLKSNEREILYLDINPADPASDRFQNTVAHEFQHMIHFNQDSSEYTWANEACSQIAPYLCGFGHANQVGSFMRTPDNSLTAWAKEQMLANYGQVYLWNYYILNRYLRDDPEARKNFFRNLVASKKQGVAGYIEALEKFSAGFTSTFDRFCIANFMNDKTLGKGEFAYDKTLARFKLPVSETVAVLPAEIAGEVFLWSADALKIELGNARSEIKISFQGFMGKMGIDQYNSFTVALILQDSTGRRSSEISYMPIKPLSSKSQGGELVFMPDAAYDSAMLIVIAQADEEVDDRVYAKAIPMQYSLKISDSGKTVVKGEGKVEVKTLVAEYSKTSENLPEAGEAGTMIALSRLEAIRRQLAEEYSRQLEDGQGNLITEIDELVDQGAINHESVAALIKDLSDVAKFKELTGH